MRKLLVILFVMMRFLTLDGQAPAINFHHLTVADGLNDGWISSICQDKQGYIWMASLGALNQYNGNKVTRYTHVQGDSTSPPASIVYNMAAGADGRFWIAYWNVLYEFDQHNAIFKKIGITEGLNINKIVPVSNTGIFLSTYQGLRLYKPGKSSFEQLIINGDSIAAKLEGQPVYDVCRKDGLLYAAAQNGFFIYNIEYKTAKFYPVKEMAGKTINKILADNTGHAWISNYEKFRLLRIETATSKTEVLDSLLISNHTENLVALDFIEDENSDVWIITNNQGLLQYHSTNGRLSYYKNDVLNKDNLTSNALRCVFRAKDGNIWIGSNAGADYFNPSKKLFSVIYPFADPYHNSFARGITEDHAGNFWFATSNGFSTMNSNTGKYHAWQNKTGKTNALYYNSTRAIIEDSNHEIFIATGRGVNRLHPNTGTMEFLTMKDSIPQAFYYSANKDSKGNIWFGTKDYDGLYYYTPSERKFHSIATHPVLKKFTGYGARIVFEDSKKRLWIGFNGNGLAMYDTKTSATRYWYNNDSTKNTIIGNLVVDIKEDKTGIIWISTFNGITGIDVDREKYTWFDDKNGLMTNITNSLAVDSLDRLWIGSAAGLMMLDKKRNFFTRFTKSDGLSSIEFTEHPGYYAGNGNIIMPTVQGYVSFNPMQYKETVSKLEFFISGLTVLGNEYTLKDKIGPGDIIRFSPGENFFSISLSAINFESPSQTHYAFKLDGFDKEWQYTQDGRAVYTNVPGGDYTFLYKASTNVNSWPAPEKSIRLHVSAYFYMTPWFWMAVVIVAVGILYFLYRSRLNNQQEIFSLETKAAALEKEKTMVQYESLKQHLNPHFLFNSLTSLRSLIKTDTKTATFFLDGMSKVYRYVLKSGEQELVMLSDELEFVRIFANLQKIRFNDGLIVHINVDELHYGKYVVPVMLQNLVENAIKHNTADQEKPLQVDIFVDANFIVVQNNLQRYRVVETSNKKGIASLQTLYRYYSSDPIEITDDGNYFTVKIPLL